MTFTIILRLSFLYVIKIADMRDKQGWGNIYLFCQVGFQSALKAVYLSKELAYN